MKIILIYLLIVTSISAKEKVEIAFSNLVKKNVSFLIDEVESIYKRIGVEAVITTYPSSRLNYLFEHGEIDAIGAKVSLYEKNNPNSLKLSTPILKDVEFRLFIKSNQLERVKKIKNPVIITAQNCLACHEFARVHNLKFSSLLGNIGTALKMLHSGRADMVIAPKVILSKIPSDIFEIYGEKSYKVNFYHFISKNIIHLKDKLEDEFKKSLKINAFDLNKLKSLNHILK